MRRITNGIGFWIMLVALLAAYLLPWVQGGSASLTFGAYDLAEWTSLHPAVRGGSPPFLAPLLLRAVLTCIVLYAAFAAPLQGAQRLLALGIVVVLSAAQLPPLEFFTSARGDANYQQQAVLALITLVIGSAAVFLGRHRYRRWVAAGAAVLGCIVAFTGITQTLLLFQRFEIAALVGMGAVLLPVLLMVCAVGAFLESKQTE